VVIAPNEFWLQLHRLAEAYSAEGLNSEERAENIVAQFREMPHVAKRAVLTEILQIAVHLPDLYPLVVAAANEAEDGKHKKPVEGAA
jgi:hypothetical protein